VSFRPRPLECHYSSCNFLPQARDALGSKFAQKVASTDQKGVRVCWLGGGRGLGGGGGMGCRWMHDPHVVITARARAMQNGFLNTQKTAKTSIPRHCVPAACPRRWYIGARLAGGRARSLMVAVCDTPSCRSLWLPRDMAVEWPGRGIFLKVENATSAFLATCLLLLATALGQLWRCRAFARL
jgi:hypothetical protein